MPKKSKLDILDLETLPANLTKSVKVGNLQWILKVLNAEKIRSLISGHPNVDKEESDREMKELLEQRESFSSALRLNKDDDYTHKDVEKAMQHFILAYDKTLNAQGIKSLDKGKYELDDEVAHYIKESFKKYLGSTKKKGELDKAFKTVKSGGVKKPFPSPKEGYVPDDIKKMTEIIMNDPYPTLDAALEIVSGGVKGEKSNLKRYWRDYKFNALPYFEMKLRLKNLDFTDEMVDQIRKYFIEDFRK